MLGLLIHKGEWVVVCDGAKALVLENTGGVDAPNFKTIRVFEQKDPATHELGTDAPGRTHNSVGTARSAVEQTDWHDQAERTFLLGMVKYLDKVLADGGIKSLVIVAPPRALGVIRPAYSAALRAALRTEVDKDLVKLPIHEIEKHLTAG